MTALTYIGNGAAIIGVPARDLTADEVKGLDWLMSEADLLKSGLYKIAGDFDKADAEKVMPQLRKSKKEGE
jgi:hypothetical protein